MVRLAVVAAEGVLGRSDAVVVAHMVDTAHDVVGEEDSVADDMDKGQHSGCMAASQPVTAATRNRAVRTGDMAVLAPRHVDVLGHKLLAALVL
jgi:hypothetical protein